MEHTALRRLTPATPRSVLTLAYAVPALLTVLDVLFNVRLTQLLVVGPCIAAISTRTRAVVLNALVVLVLMTYLASPNHTAGTVQEVFTTAGGIAVGAVCVAVSRRQEVLQRSVARIDARRTVLAGIVESASEAIVGSQLDGTITVWNAGAERLYGYPAAAAVGRNLTMLYPPEAIPTLRAIRDRVVAGECVEQHETTRLHADGRLLDLFVTMSPIRNPDGTVVGAAVLARDLAPRKRAEQERLALVNQVHQLQRVESLGQLAGGIAHDFNNLLSVIISSAEFIEGEIDDPVAILSDTAQVRSAADRAAKLTRQLLQFARGEHLPPRVIDVNALVSGLEDLLVRSAGDTVEVVVEKSPIPPMVYADPGRIEQVLLNLVVNARDAMPDGGTVVISTEVSSTVVGGTGASTTVGGGEDPGAVAVAVDGDPAAAVPTVRISVSDTGTGMTPEVAERVFEPFFSTKDKGHGTGLGLASVYGIVTEARGHISVQTTPGGGSTFSLELPLVDGAPDAIVAAPREPAPPAAGARVLVVEDEGPIGDVVSRLLRRAGYDVLLARSGPEGLRLGVDSDVDLLLSDVLMPGMSGRALAAALAEHKPGLPVLFMSGYSDTVLDMAGPDRAVDLLPKPFTERQLLDRVHAALDRVSPGRG